MNFDYHAFIRRIRRFEVPNLNLNRQVMRPLVRRATVQLTSGR